MPQRAWNAKRERQYEHVKGGLEERGRPEDEAEEIAARTVNKERARNGEAQQASRTSTEDISSGRRGGIRSHRGPGGRTRDQLYQEAREKNVKGRSKMSKRQAERADGRAGRSGAVDGEGTCFPASVQRARLRDRERSRACPAILPASDAPCRRRGKPDTFHDCARAIDDHAHDHDHAEHHDALTREIEPFYARDYARGRPRAHSRTTRSA